MATPSLQFPPAHWPGGRYSFLLAALVLMFAVEPLVQQFPLGALVLDGFSVLVLLSAVLSMGSRRVVLIILLGVGAAEVLALAAGWLIDPQGSLGAGPAGVFRALLAAAFFGYLAAIIMGDVISSRQETFDKLCGATCVYLLLGLLWAYVYLVIHHYAPGSFAIGDELQQAVTSTGNNREFFTLLVYFSFVTLTTLGFGDISPVTGPALTACWLEAVTGQLFLATFIAGLVGIHVSRGSNSSERDGTSK